MKIKKIPVVIIALLAVFIINFSAFGFALAPDEKMVPAIMYHNILNKKSLLGKFVITPLELEEDLIYLKENGYETVTISDLIAFTEDGTPLPEKPIMLTFDDGDLAIYTVLLPLLEKYNMKAVVSIIGSFTDKYSDTDIKGPYPNLIWSQVKELIESGHVEIQNHTYDLHKGQGVKKKPGESEENYKIRLTKDLETLQERMKEMTNYEAQAFTYPFGLKSPSSDSILKEMGFKASISCAERINLIKTENPDCLFSLGRFIRPHGVNLGKIFAQFNIS